MIQGAYYSSFDEEQILKLLRYVEMIIFHSLILLMSSKEQIDINDFKIYLDEFNKLLKSDYSVERYQDNIRKEFSEN